MGCFLGKYSKKELKWGNIIIQNMSTKHIVNAQMSLKRNNPNSQYIEIFEIELTNRIKSR